MHFAFSYTQANKLKFGTAKRVGMKNYTQGMCVICNSKTSFFCKLCGEHVPIHKESVDAECLRAHSADPMLDNRGKLEPGAASKQRRAAAKRLQNKAESAKKRRRLVAVAAARVAARMAAGLRSAGHGPEPGSQSD